MSFAFEMNSDAIIKKKTDCGFTITYPKTTIYLTYKPVTKNINELLRDAQKQLMST
jgi:hypothetical protein